VGSLDDEGLRWRGAGDRRPAVRIAPSDVLGVHGEEGEGVPDDLRSFAVVTPHGTLFFAAAAEADWEARLRRLAGEEVDDEHAQDR
jgi:hypothetical protein